MPRPRGGSSHRVRSVGNAREVVRQDQLVRADEAGRVRHPS